MKSLDVGLFPLHTQIRYHHWLTLVDSLDGALLASLQPNSELIVTVEVADNGSPPLTAEFAFTLRITNISEYLLPDITLSNRRMIDNATVGSIISALQVHNTTLEAQDLEFVLIRNGNGKFELRNKSLILLEEVSFTAAPSHQIVIRAVSKYDPSIAISATFAILILPSKECRRKCDENAKCSRQNDSSYSCSCNDGYVASGLTCQAINYCQKQPCVHGLCHNQLLNFVCRCHHGFSGRMCEVDTRNGCLLDPCQNGALCEPRGIDNYTCHCKKGWTGTNCSESVDECETTMCLHESECKDSHLTYICICPENFIGLRCEFHIKSCRIDVCDLSAECVPAFNQTNAHYCNERENSVTLLIQNMDSNVAEIHARFLDFFYLHVQQYVKPAVPTEDENSTAVSNYFPINAYVYVFELQHKLDSANTLQLSMFVMTVEGQPYTQKQTLDELTIACHIIG